MLSRQLKELDESLEAEQSKKAQLAMVKKQDERITQLEKKEEELAAKYEQLQKGIYLCEQFVKAKTKLLDEKINSRFKTLRFRLFIEQQNGGIADDCEALVPCKTGLVPFKSANNAARINAGLELTDTLAEYYGVERGLCGQCGISDQTDTYRNTGYPPGGIRTRQGPEI